MNVYFSGLGGVGIGPLTEIALGAGHTVAGSDIVETPLTRELREKGIEVNIGQDGTFLRSRHEDAPVDVFVYTSALPHDHPELLLAKELGIATSKRDAFLAKLISDTSLKLIAVAGTHGKTTTTGMAVWAFKSLGIPVSYSVGSTLSFGPSGAFDPRSEYFIYECDEYDRNFLQFSPEVSLITSVDYDHPDTYPTKDSYIEAFQAFITQSSHTIAWRRDAEYLQLNAALQDTQNSEWILEENETLSFAIPGEHNRRNATLVAKLLEYLAIGSSVDTQRALESFPGTSRRFEKLADNLYSDYGHHPVEIAATLELARELSDHIVLVYQPHQNQRQHLIRHEYTTQFERAEAVYWLPTYLSREDPLQPILTPSELFSEVSNPSIFRTAEFDDSLWNAVQEARTEGKLVLFMGAGSIDEWVRARLTESQLT